MSKLDKSAVSMFIYIFPRTGGVVKSVPLVKEAQM